MSDVRKPENRERRSQQSVALPSLGQASPISKPDQVTHLVIGQVVAPRGLHGELRIRIETDDPERFHLLREVYLGNQLKRFDVKAARLFRNQAFLQLHSIEDRDTAEKWRGAYVYVHVSNALPLAEGEYYYHQIQGLTAVTPQGKTLGRVASILPTGANDVYVVESEEGELLLPAIKDVILRVDLEAGIIVVRLPDGLR